MGLTELQAMDIVSKSLFSRPPVAALALAVALLGMGTSSASAQWFGWDPALPPMQVERMIQASGYRLTGPVIRNGSVYLANVLGREDDPERLVLDASDGRLLQRFRAGRARPRFASGDWSGQPRPQTSISDGFMDHLSDLVGPPRPPGDIYSDGGGEPFRPPLAAPATTLNEVAHADEGSSPHVILAPDRMPSPALEKPRLKPQVKRVVKKPETTAVALPAATPAEVKPAITPSVVAPVRSEAAVEPTVPTPQVADTKATPAPATAVTAPIVAAPKPAAPLPQTAVATPVVAPTPKAPAPKPAVNDVPVSPLE